MKNNLILKCILILVAVIITVAIAPFVFANKNSAFEKCKLNKQNTCTITANGKNYKYSLITTKQITKIDYYRQDGVKTENKVCDFDNGCNKHESIAPAGNYWVSEDLGFIEPLEAISTECRVLKEQYEKYSENEYVEQVEKKCNNNKTCMSQFISKMANLERKLNQCTIDFHAGAKRKCEAQGAHLATLAELELISKEGKLQGVYWASEKLNDKVAWIIYRNSTGNGFLDGGYIYHNDRKVVCVGN